MFVCFLKRAFCGGEGIWEWLATVLCMVFWRWKLWGRDGRGRTRATSLESRSVLSPNKSTHRDLLRAGIWTEIMWGCLLLLIVSVTLRRDSQWERNHKGQLNSFFLPTYWRGWALKEGEGRQPRASYGTSSLNSKAGLMGGGHALCKWSFTCTEF